MLIISAREDFFSSTKLAVKDDIRDVDLKGSKPASPSLKRPGHPKTHLLQQVRGKKVLVLFHGFNNEPEDVHEAYSIVEKSYKAKYDLVIGYSWPGGNDGLDYFSAKRRANALARRVGLLIRDLSGAATALDVMAHSMGNRVVLKALKNVSSGSVRNFWSMAAAVDNESIQKGEDFFESTKGCKNMVVFHSKRDGVLRNAYAMAEWDRALGLHGPEDVDDIVSFSSPTKNSSPNVYVVNSKNQVSRHGGYKRCKAISTYIEKFIHSGNRHNKQFLTL